MDKKNIKEKTTEQTGNDEEKRREILYFTVRCSIKGEPTIYTPPEFLKKFKDFLVEPITEEELGDDFWKATDWMCLGRLYGYVLTLFGREKEFFSGKKVEFLHKVQPLVYACPKDAPDTLFFYYKWDIGEDNKDVNKKPTKMLTKSQEKELDKLVSDIEKLLKEP